MPRRKGPANPLKHNFYWLTDFPVSIVYRPEGQRLSSGVNGIFLELIWIQSPILRA